MEIPKSLLTQKALTVTDVYTNLQGLQGLKHAENQEESLKKVAQQFESMFISLLMKNVRSANAVFEKDSLFNSKETEFYREMLDQQRALSLSHSKGFGIADVLYRQLSRNYGLDKQGLDKPGLDKNAQNTSGSSLINEAGLRELPRDMAKPARMSTSLNATINTDNIENSLSRIQENFSDISFESPQDFVKSLIPYAEKAAEKIGVDKLLLIAQSALETGWGQHVIQDSKGRSSHNMFNIKGNPQTGVNTVKHATLEYLDGVFKQENANFRAYGNVQESFDDYADFVKTNSRYQTAIDVAVNSEQYIRKLHEAGYATDPDYSEKVLSVYRRITDWVDELSAINPQPWGIAHDK